jgi:protein translocase SecG subunit
MFLNISTYNWLLILQVIFLVLVTGLILIQQRGASIGSAFGGAGQVYLTRRGIEKYVVNLTVISIVAFVILRGVSLFF